MSGIFEHLAAFDNADRDTSRKAVAVANKRVKDRFLPFISAAKDDGERKARLDFISEDLSQVIVDVVEEYGGDPEHIEAAIKESLTPEQMGQMPMGVAQQIPGQPPGQPPSGVPMGLAQEPPHPPEQVPGQVPGQPVPGQSPVPPMGVMQKIPQPPPPSPGVAQQMQGIGQQALHPGQMQQQEEQLKQMMHGSVKEARRPKMCPYHSEVVDVSLGSGDPQAGYNAMSSHAWSPNHCKGGFDGTCNFRPQMVAQKYWDDKQAEYDQRRQERDDQRRLDEQNREVDPLYGDRPPEQQHFEEPEQSFDGINEELDSAPSAVGGGEMGDSTPEPSAVPMLASHEAAKPETGDSTETRESLPNHKNDGTTGLATQPSPKIDKNTWKPNALNENGNLKPVDTEGSGSPHPTEHQDAPDKADYDNDDFKEQSEAVTESQDLPSADDSGYSTERNVEQPTTDTWSGTEGQAQPVTSAIDVEKNPLRDLIESDFDGFLPANTVQSAIEEYEDGRNGS